MMESVPGAVLERVSEQLGMSGRALQRKLRDHGTSHQELLDQMRKDLAMRYLREPEMAICEVAYLLGFSESSALHRAFKTMDGNDAERVSQAIESDKLKLVLLQKRLIGEAAVRNAFIAAETPANRSRA